MPNRLKWSHYYHNVPHMWHTRATSKSYEEHEIRKKMENCVFTNKKIITFPATTAGRGLRNAHNRNTIVIKVASWRFTATAHKNLGPKTKEEKTWRNNIVCLFISFRLVACVRGAVSSSHANCIYCHRCAIEYEYSAFTWTRQGRSIRRLAIKQEKRFPPKTISIKSKTKMWAEKKENFVCVWVVRCARQASTE